MNNVSLKPKFQEHAREFVKLANERFGYRQTLRAVLTGFGYDAETIEKVLDLARTRQIEKVKQSLK